MWNEAPLNVAAAFTGENRWDVFLTDTGEPLPEWMQYNRHNNTLRFLPPYKIDALNVTVRAYAADDTWTDDMFVF